MGTSLLLPWAGTPEDICQQRQEQGAAQSSAWGYKEKGGPPDQSLLP